MMKISLGIAAKAFAAKDKKELIDIEFRENAINNLAKQDEFRQNRTQVTLNYYHARKIQLVS